MCNFNHFSRSKTFKIQVCLLKRQHGNIIQSQVVTHSDMNNRLNVLYDNLHAIHR